MRRSYLVSLALMSIAVLLLFTVQFLPWGHFEADMTVPAFDSGDFGGFGGFSSPAMSLDMDLWFKTWSLSWDVNGESDSESWFDDDVEGDGTGQIRAGAILVLSCLVLASFGLGLNLLRFGNAAGALAGLAAVVGVLGFIFMSIGVNEVADGEQNWHVGFYLGLVALAALVAGCVAAFLPPDEPTGGSGGAPRGRAKAAKDVNFD